MRLKAKVALVTGAGGGLGVGAVEVLGEHRHGRIGAVAAEGELALAGGGDVAWGCKNQKARGFSGMGGEAQAAGLGEAGIHSRIQLVHA